MARQPLKYHGGKSYLAKDLIDLMPRHLHYVEPFFGGGAVLFRKDPMDPRHEWSTKSHERGKSEVINDIDGELTNFWKVLQGEESFQRFLRRITATPFGQIEFDEAMRCESDDPIERAVHLFLRLRQSRQGLGRDFATLSRNRTRRFMNEQASAWLSAIDGLPEAHERLRGVVICNMDALRLIPQQDGPKTLFYFDPPYLHETRVTKKDYRHEMTREQHVELLEVLVRCEGKVMLSGYPNDLYDDRLRGWRTHDIAIDNKASGSDTKPIKIERIWMNYGE